MLDQKDQYDRVQKILHWLIALGIFFMIGLGFFMIGLPKESELPPGQESVRAFYFLLHKSTGLTIGLLVLFRVIWRLTHQAPELPSYITSWQKTASKAVHGLLYVLMVAVPVSGYLQSMYSPYDTKFWGMVLPRLAEADKDMRGVFHEAHEILVFTLIAVLIIHIAAAVKHRLAGTDIHKRMSLFD